MEKATYLPYMVALSVCLLLLPDNALCKSNDAIKFKKSDMLPYHNEKNKMHNNERIIEQQIVNKRETPSRYQINPRHADTVNISSCQQF